MSAPVSISMAALAANHEVNVPQFLLKNIPFTPNEKMPGETAKAMDILEEVFSELRRENFMLIAEIFSKFGRIAYQENKSNSMAMMRGSLTTLFYNLGLIDTPPIQTSGYSLSGLLRVFADDLKFASFDDFILTSDMVAVGERIQNLSLSPFELFLIGFTLTRYGISLNDSEGYSNNSQINLKRFEQIYALAEIVLRLSNTERSKLEICDLYFCGYHNLELKKDPTNFKAAHAMLDKALEFCSTDYVRAKVAEQKFTNYLEIKDDENALKWMYEVLPLQERLKPEEQDHNLVAKIYAFESDKHLETENLRDAKIAINKSLAIAESKRGERDPKTDFLMTSLNDHRHYGLFDLQMARIGCMEQHKTIALKHVNRAIETFTTFIQLSQEELKAALELKEYIEKM